MRQPWYRRLPIFTACAGVVFLSGNARASAYISKVSGIVQLQHSGTDRWELVRDVPLDVADQDSVRTGRGAQTTLSFDDGSRVELGPNATFTLEESSRGRSSIKLNFGALKAFVQRIAARRFEVKTPTAVCSVRGTEFKVEVLAGGQTVVDLYKGLLAVEDRRGQQILLHPNETIHVDLRGLNKAAGLPTKNQARQTAFHAIMQREMGLELSKHEILASAAREVKLAEFQQGKALIDVHGDRVRLEEYIIRPSPNQFKLVVLDQSKENGLNLFSYLGTFNQNLPADLKQALNQLNGTVDTAPTWWLTGFQTVRTNTQDSIVEIANGGHPVDVNHNGVPGDQIAFLFNPVTNTYMSVAGHNVYQTLFDNYGFYVNSRLTYGWATPGGNVQSYTLVTNASTVDPISGAALTAANAWIDPNTGQLATRSVSSTFPDADQIHQVIFESYSTGDFIRWDNYIFTNDGQIATTANFNAATAGTSYLQGILKFNFEQDITSSQFSGRKIDLVVEPKILVQAGLIQ